MSETKFIIGPYIAANYSKKKIGVGRPGGGAFLFVTPRQGDDFDEQLLYTIHLMTLAPDMYALLETATGMFSGTEFAKKAEQLLAKARGEV